MELFVIANRTPPQKTRFTALFTVLISEPPTVPEAGPVTEA